MNTITESEQPLRESIVRPALRGWWIVALCLLAGAAAAAIITRRETKQYEATSQLLFRNDTSPDQTILSVFGLPVVSESPDPTQTAATNVALVSLGTVSSLTAQALGHGMTGAEVQSDVAISEVGQSNVISITATASNPDTAAAIANTYAREFVQFRHSADASILNDGAQILQTQLQSLSPAQQASAFGRSLTNDIQRLSGLARLQIGNEELVQSAGAPTSASSPSPKRNLALGALLGLVIGIVIAIFVYRSDGSAAEPVDVADVYALPLLGVVPRIPGIRSSSNGGARDGIGVLPPPAEDVMRAVWARLRYASTGRPLRSVLFTSAVSGEGKSTIAREFARVAAMRGDKTVLLVEADLRHPSLELPDALERSPGLSEALHSSPEAADSAIQTVSPKRDRWIPDVVDRQLPLSDTSAPALDVIVAGARSLLSPSELLDSQTMSDLFERWVGRYDLVVIDGPSAEIPAETLPLMKLVDGVIVVSSMWKTGEAAEDLRSQVETAGSAMLGVVVNNATPSRVGQQRNGATRKASDRGAINRNGSDKSRRRHHRRAKGGDLSESRTDAAATHQRARAHSQDWAFGWSESALDRDMPRTIRKLALPDHNLVRPNRGPGTPAGRLDDLPQGVGADAPSASPYEPGWGRALRNLRTRHGSQKSPPQP